MNKYHSFKFLVFPGLVQLYLKVLDFVDCNGNDVLQLGSTVKLSEETIRTILSRPSLGADEFVKFQVRMDFANLSSSLYFYWQLNPALGKVSKLISYITLCPHKASSPRKTILSTHIPMIGTVSKHLIKMS